MPEHVWESIASAGLPALLMAAAVWWLQKTNSTLICALNEEREDRMARMDKEIERLRSKSDECERDRLALHREIAKVIRDGSCPVKLGD